MFRNVLVGVNDADGGRDAIAVGKMLVARDGELTLAHVYHQDPPGPWRMADLRVGEEREGAREILERAAAETGVQAHIRWRGAPTVGRGLHEMAEMLEADLLVVGSSRHGLLGRAALGDDARAALNGAPCAIAIAPAGYGTEPSPLVREIGVGYDGSPESEHALGVAGVLATETQSYPLSRQSRFRLISPTDARRPMAPRSSSSWARRARGLRATTASSRMLRTVTRSRS